MTCRLPIFTLLLFWTGVALGQASYAGTVGTAPVEMVIEADQDGAAYGMYVYTRFDTSIALSGNLHGGTLVFTEKNSLGKAFATLTLPAFSTTAKTASGVWKNLATGQTLPLALTQQLAGEAGEASAGVDQGLLQAASSNSTYFRAALPSSGGPVNIQVFAKRTDRLLQTIPVEGPLRGMNTVTLGDFNFDGFDDFAVFEQSFAGPNTSSLYFLYDPAHKQYVPSGFSGTSLEFDAKTKRIYETNSCCAGSSVQKFIYKVVNNRMVLLAQHCYKWNEKTQKLVERKVSACQ